MRRKNHDQRKKLTARMESLEKREMFATVSFAGSVLNISGDNGTNNVAITDNGDGDLQIWADGRSYTGNNITRINIDAKKGSDTVTYSQNGTRWRSMDLNVQLGDGNDVFRAYVNGDIYYNRTLDIAVDGNNGNDRIYAFATNDVDVRLGGTLRLDLDGDDGRDTIFALYRGEADGTIKLRERGGEDNDYLYASVRADAGSRGRLTWDGNTDARLEGNDDSDSLRFYVYKDSHDPFAVAAKADGGERSWWEFWDSDNDYGYHTANVRTAGLEHNFVV